MNQSLADQFATTMLSGGNADFIEDLYEHFLRDPAAIDPAWRSYFEALAGTGPADVAHGPLRRELAERARHGNAERARGSEPADEITARQGAVSRLIQVYANRGHLCARLDPLGLQKIEKPSVLELAHFGLSDSDLDREFFTGSRTEVFPKRATLRAILQMLTAIYMDSIGAEFAHVSNTQERLWLQDTFQNSQMRRRFPADEQQNILRQLTAAEGLERYLHNKYVGQKRFSLEGGDSLIPLLDDLIQQGGAKGIEEAIIGMAHRGRLNVLVNLLGKSPKDLFNEFDGEYDLAKLRGSGDVKYHKGYSADLKTPHGNVHVVLAFNPSHLEVVNPVVEGSVRARQERRGDRSGVKVLPVLIHGDAAFAGQGVIMETLQLSQARGFYTGGSVHIIINNQVGFTTDPRDARSTRYASDLAKGFDVPIVHVNADDVDACIAAVHLAVDFRHRFGHDVIIDLIGYRRFGHNETDEPAYTQPDMYERIKSHPTVRELYAQKLIAQGIETPEGANELVADATSRLTNAHQNVKTGAWQGAPDEHVAHGDTALATYETKIDRARLVAWNDALVRVPEGFTVHPKLVRQLERRKSAFETEGEFDWGLGESLAFASLLAEGTPIRLTGQDTQRGTFSHRHLVFHDAKTNATHAPIQHLDDARASFELYNSPLSEYACLGFEYGYAVELPNALVLWEAQFGDFNNGAQIIIDQFIAAGQAKWGETSRLVLLLPHGYEGAGPEHSSARIERFLQLSAEGNVQVANCSTPAQYFHLLRLQARQQRALPLVIFTPKSLLRLKAAAGHIEDLTDGTFRSVMDDPRHLADRAAVERVILCSGKIYYDLIAHDDYARMTKTAIVRVELLSPLPVREIVDVLESYPNLTRIDWVQEEPKNMGARAHVRRRLIDKLPNGLREIGYVGRPYRASPSEGYGGAHALEQERIVTEALAG